MTTATEERTLAERCGAAVAEIAALANSNVGDQAFIRGVLEQTAAALDAVAGGLWSLTPQGVLNLAGDLRLAETGVTRDPAKGRLNVGRIIDVARAGRSAVYDEALSPGGAAPGPAIVLAPIAARGRCQGVLEVFLADAFPVSERRAAIQFVEEVCRSITQFFTWRDEDRAAAGSLEFRDRFERAIAGLHASLDPQEVALTAVNEGRALLGCDRMSLVVQRGRRTDVLAVSGQERVNRSSNLIRSLAELAAEAIRGNRPVETDRESEGLPPAIERLLIDYLRIGGLRMVKVLPLEVPRREEQPAASPKPARPARAFAALAIEQFTDARCSPVAAERAARYAAHVASALHNARAHQQVFLLPLARGIGRFGAWLAGRPLAKLATGVVLLTGVVGALACIPATYRVEGKGKLMPVVQRNVFAPRDGEVVAVHVAGGDRVEAGQLLLQLRSDELQSQLLAARNREAEKQQQHDALQAEIGESNRRPTHADDLLRLRGRLVQTRVELEGAAERVADLERQLEQLAVRAPISGTVATFQVEQSLLSRPVRRGEVLLEVMDEDDAWRLEIAIPEQRMGHLLAAAKQHADRPLASEFVLATAPEETMEGEVSLVSTRTDVSPDQGAIVDVYIAVDAAAIKHRRIGAEAVAKIDCGRRSLGYVLFGDAVEFVQRRLW